MPEPDFDIHRAGRWFAVEYNNRAWEMIERGALNDSQRDLLVHLAHGACAHWLEAGDLLNHLRAQVLLASAHGAVGNEASAVAHARRALALSEEAGARQTTWDRASVHGCAAKAFAAASDPAAAEQTRLARAARDALDADDQAVFDTFFSLAGPASAA